LEVKIQLFLYLFFSDFQDFGDEHGFWKRFCNSNTKNLDFQAIAFFCTFPHLPLKISKKRAFLPKNFQKIRKIFRGVKFSKIPPFSLKFA